MAEPIRVLVTGAAGQIAYSLLYSIAKGDVFGKDQPIILVLLDIPPMLPVLEGVVMELQDCALPLLREVIPTDKVEVGFKDLDAAILVGSMPRKEGMERKDLLKANVAIFKTQGTALEKYAKKTVKVLVVGNPANTNCLIASKSAPSIPKENFSCLTRLDHNRARSQVAMRVGVSTDNVKNVIIWGNHSSTQYPDVHHCKVDLHGKEVAAYDAIKDDGWLKGDFISTVQLRGAAVIKARKLSSAMSAAKAICDHMRDIWFGTPEGEWVSMGIYAGGNSYGIPEDLMYSFPVMIKNKTWKVVDGLSINDFSRGKMEATATELVDERDTAVAFLSV
ncbi:malate dehydrogenase 1Aa, NAD (soluble) isoform X2 [Clupea harengus]|uniref:Malate dehydrogenase n=1 Tax=Clupea harengus TaxID=7950 RepID=A0A6P3WA66_CLUHA|nr:malate dehydrogenase 1Aa, NAD (soluble) isoform X2 [Clupea harengus]